MKSVRLLSAKDIQALYPMSEAISVVETAFADHAEGRSKMPAKIYLDLPQFSGDFRAMPAYCDRYRIAGVKWVNSHPKNGAKNLPAVMALLVLNDPETGIPKAVLEASTLTNIRTGAAGAVAAKTLARADASVAAFIGGGHQAIQQAIGLLQVRQLRKIKLFDPSENAGKTFAAAIKSISVESCSDPESALRDADIVVTTTPSRKPIVRASWIRPGVHINAIGADAPGKQELDADILRRASVFVDDVEQASHSGEINVPISHHQFAVENISATLGDVISGKKNGRRMPDEVTLFDSTGLAIQDISSAGWILKKAEELGVGTLFSFSDFF